METESTKNEIFTDFSSIYEEFGKYIHHFGAFQILNFINIISELTIILITITLCFNENRSWEVMILLLTVTMFSSFLLFKTIKTQTILNGDFKITVCTFDSAAKVLTDWCYVVHVDLSYFSLINLILDLRNDHFYQFRINNVFIKLIICDMLIFLLNVICLTSGYFFLNYSYYAEAQVLLLITLSLLISSCFFLNDRSKKYDNKNTFLREKIGSLMQKISKEFPDKNKHIPTNDQSDNQNNSISSDYEENNELINILNNSERPVIETNELVIERNNSDDSTTEKPDKTCMENEQNNIDAGNSPHNDAEVQSIDQSVISNINNYHSSYNEIENATLVSENSHSNGTKILQNSMNNFYLYVDHEGNSVEGQDDMSCTDNTNELDNEKNNNYESTIKKYDNVYIEKKQRDVEDGKSVENTQYSDTAAQNADKNATLTVNHSHNSYNGNKNTITPSENRYSVNIEKETLQESMTKSYVSVDYEDNAGEEQADMSYTDNNNSQLNYAKGFVAENTKLENQRNALNEKTAEKPDSIKHESNKSDNENNKLLIKIPPDDSYFRSVEQNTVLDDIHCQTSYNENEYPALICRNSYGDKKRILKETYEDEFSVDGEDTSLEGQSDVSAEEITNKISFSQKCTITSKLKENGEETVSAFNDDERSVSVNGKLANETNTCKENMIKKTNSVTENNTFNVENNDEDYVLKEPNTGSDSQSTEQNTVFSYNNGQHSNHENENIASSNENSFGSEQNTLQEVLENNLFLNAKDNTVEERSDRNSANEEIFQQKLDECSQHIKFKETEEAILQFNNNKRYGSENVDLENVRNTDSENNIQEPGFINFKNYKRKADDNESVARVSHSDSISQIFKQSVTLNDLQYQHTNDGNKCSASTSENNYSYKNKISVDHGKAIEVTPKAVSALIQSEKDTHDHCLNTDSNSVDYQEDIKSGNDVRNRDKNRCNKEETKSAVAIERSDSQIDYYSTDPIQSTAKSDGYDKTAVISNNEKNPFDNFFSSSNQKERPNSFPVVSNGQLEDVDKKEVISEKKDSENVTKNECDGIQQFFIAPISDTENITESKISKLDSAVATGNLFQNEMHFSEHTLSKSTETENNASYINHHYMTDGVRKEDQYYVCEGMPDVDTSWGFRDKKSKKHKNKFCRKGKKQEIYPSETTSIIAPRTFEGNKESTKRDFLTKNSDFSLENRAAEEASRKGVTTLSQNKFKVEIHAHDDISFDYQSSSTTTTEGNLKEAHQFRLRKLKEKRHRKLKAFIGRCCFKA